MSGAMHGKQWKHAAVPVAHAFTGLSAIFILDIKTPAGGAYEGTCSAIYAGKRYLVPEWCMVKLGGVDLL
jgi:hypothetical protein